MYHTELALNIRLFTNCSNLCFLFTGSSYVLVIFTKTSSYLTYPLVRSEKPQLAVVALSYIT